MAPSSRGGSGSRHTGTRTGRSVAQRRRQAVLTALALVLIGVVVGVTWLIDQRSAPGETSRSATVASATDAPGSRAASGSRAAPDATASGRSPSRAASSGIPARVTRTLALIDAGDWPEAARAPGTKGGLVFGNNEGLLPSADDTGRRITYREWDVNPKQRGRSRDAERIVTGSDGSAWYTADHYRSFVRIRGPDT
ncbi:hypothetical protein GCM10009624_26350 [Gordonia sinesedis]